MLKVRRLFVPFVALVLCAMVFNLSSRAEEGFWPYNGIPKAAIKAKYGFDVTDAWLNHLQLSTVRFQGGTGSVVSPNGLVLTNHHIALSSLQRLSTPDKDFVKSGFVAESMAGELKVPGMSLSVLQTIEDVTPKVIGAVTAGMSPQEAAAARQAAITSLQTGAQPGTSKQVVTLYAGAVYNLYTYKVYSDVRLVFGAEYQAGFYGGDPDNFTFPRYCLDVGMFRLYENDKPAVTPNFLKWSPAGSKEGELVFTTGHPGATQRLNTVAHLKYRRDLAIPFAIAVNESREASLQKWMALSPENARSSTSDLFGIQNTLKSLRGQLKGLQDPAVMSVKEAAESRLRGELAKNAAKQAELGDAWDTIAKSIDVARQIDADRNFIVLGAGLNSTLFAQARQFVRNANVSRDGTPAVPPMPPVNLQREKINLTDSLTLLVKYLGPDHAITKRIMLGKTVDARVTELLSTRIGDPEIRALLTVGRKAAIDVATDPMIVLARSLETDVQAITERFDKEVVAMQAAAYPKIGQAVFVVDGPKAYPDATGTLRLSYGSVRNYLENGKPVAPYTVFGGLYERSDQHQNQPPYDLVPRWAEAKNALDPKTPFDFVSTNDIVGGNSGSPVVNKKGEIVGLIFDGNIQSLPGYFIYQEDINRAVSVDSRAILEALRTVYKATAIADEIAGHK